MSNNKNEGPIDRRCFLGETLATGCCCMGAAVLGQGLFPDTAEAQDRKSRNTGSSAKNPLLTPIAYCGLFCGACGGLQDTVKSGKTDGCLGCKSNLLGGHCKTCKVRECAQQRKVVNCGVCADYPCDKIKEYHNDENEGTYMAVARKNSEDFLYFGNLEDEGWSERQSIRWSCPKCKTPFQFNSKTCPKCGGNIRTVQDEANVYARRNKPSNVSFEGRTWQDNLAYKTEEQKFGGKNSLRIQGNERTIVFLPDAKFREGILECDLAVGSFGGLAFHVSEDARQAELMQFRILDTKKERNKRILAYCVHKDWQTGWRELRRKEPGKYDVATKIAKDKWFHLKLVLTGKNLEVFINEDAEPVLTVETLGNLKGEGVGVFGADVRFAGFSIG